MTLISKVLSVKLDGKQTSWGRTLFSLSSFVFSYGVFVTVAYV